MRVGDLVAHIRDSKVLGIVVAIHDPPQDTRWADVLWTDEDRPFLERMRNLRVVSCK